MHNSAEGLYLTLALTDPCKSGASEGKGGFKNALNGAHTFEGEQKI